MANRYRKEIINGKTRYIPDPNGQEMWRLKGYKTKPGRKPNPEKRVRISLLLPPEMVDWLREKGSTATIEAAIRKEMDR